MSQNKKLWKSYYKWILLLIPLVSVFIAFIYRLEGYAGNFSVLEQVLHSVFYTAIIWTVSMFIVRFLWIKFPWELHPIKHLIIEALLILFFTNGFVLIIHRIEVHAGLLETSDNIISNILISNLITFLILTIHEAVLFYRQWKYNFSKSIRLEKDNIEAKYESLKAQVNPHFLFNSLNSLTTLVDTNEKAVTYIQNLSEFLRYMLKSRDTELVLLKDEVEIVKKYLSLQKSRFKNNLHADINIPGTAQKYSVPPLVLQMLIENCIKHNIVSKEKPLSIKVYTQKETLVVENNLEKKETNTSTGQGLKNIMERYRFFTSTEVQVIETSGSFQVKIPLLSIEI